MVAKPSAPDRDRLIEWFSKWRKPICTWLRHRAWVSPDDVDDVAQEVFLRLLRFSNDIAVENPQGYLFRIAANVANEWRMHSCIRHPHHDCWLEDLQTKGEDEPENALARASANRHIQAVLEKLPTRKREVLLLHVNEGLTYKQISKQQRLTYRIVVRDLTRAYSQLRMQLKLEDL